MKKWQLYTSKEIKPQGWIKSQLEIQAKGLSGNLDKVWNSVKESAWIGRTGDSWERMPYWLDGFIPLAYLLEDEDMISRAREYMDIIISRQKEDGWICPYDDADRSKYDTWAVILISKVLTVYYDCSGDERVPSVVYRALKNYYEMLKEEKIKIFDWGKYRWFEAFIALNMLDERFGEEWIRDFARLLKAQGTDYCAITEKWKHPLYCWQWDTHIVNLVMMLKSEAVSHELLGEEYEDVAEKLYGILKEYNGTPVGLFTGDECLSGRSPIQGTELCSVVEQMYSYELLYAYTGDRKWAERLEVLGFNALPATISDDMWAHQYLQQSNQIACQKIPGKPLFGTNNGEAHLFGLEPHFGCCTSNFNQGWPKFALAAFMHSEDCVISAVPLPSELKTEDIYVSLETNYPFENSFRYTIKAERDMDFVIRIPSFAQELTVDREKRENGDVTVKLSAGESREITVSYVTAPCFESRPYGLSTVKCGSLVFSLPIDYEKRMLEYEKDGCERKFPYCDYEYLPKSDWNYAYCESPLSVEKREISDIPFSSQQPPVVIKARVKPIDWGLEPGYDTVCAKVPQSREPIGEAKEIELYPYGCAKLRMTELPKI